MHFPVLMKFLLSKHLLIYVETYPTDNDHSIEVMTFFSNYVMIITAVVIITTYCTELYK